MREWTEKANKLKELFGHDISSHSYFQKARLEHYRSVSQIPFSSMNNGEKLMMRILKGEIRLLEKQLYPLWIIRAGRSVKRWVSPEKDSKPATPNRAILEVRPVKKSNIQPVRLAPKKGEILTKRRLSNNHNFRMKQ